jgi:predicted house-cleaning noncanonical NTP pyrophosphatase (MazG superfamily)
MELKIEVNNKDLVEAVARVYAEKLYANQMDRLFGLKTDIKELIKKKGRKMMIEMPATQKYIEQLLSDKKFLRECIEEILKEKTDDVLDALRS